MGSEDDVVYGVAEGPDFGAGDVASVLGYYLPEAVSDVSGEVD